MPGAIDIHTHFLPESVMRSVWDYFGRAEVEYGRPWPIVYRWPERMRVQHLRDMGVRHFPALSYAHRPGMARWLNQWSAQFAKETPGCLRSGTFFPESGVEAYMGQAVADGLQVAKVHLQVGDFDPRDPLLDGVWPLLAEAGVPVVVHCGSAPLPGRFTGVGPIRAVIDRHPSLRVVIAHMGAGEFDEFFALVRQRPGLYLDTTMALTDFMEQITPFPRHLLPDLRALAGDGRVLLGTDFPNIPYPYAHQIEALQRAGLTDSELAVVVWRGPRDLLPLAPATVVDEVS